MCLSCGCNKPNDDMGDERSITMTTLREAAEAAGITPEEAVENIGKGVKAG